ncbi:MAG: prepilin peptidase [bacterium]|nr:prepilin peptidase [bacterium]
MLFLGSFFVFVFGLIVGSFLNVIALRYNSGLSPLEGRSACFSCGKELRWYELLPVVSFLVQKGRCRACGSKISWQYPIVELLTATVFLLTYLKDFSPFNFSFFVIIFSLLIVIGIYDLRHKIIPDGLVYTFIALSLAKLFMPELGFVEIPDFLDLVAGPLFFLPLGLLWFFSGGRWIGFGDAKLALGIGWFLGFIFGLSAVVLAFWVGAAVGILLLVGARLQSVMPQGMRLFLGTRNLTMKSEIPFAPFLILGTVLIFFFPTDLVGIAALLELYQL